MQITVYTLPRCIQCDRTKNWLTKNGIPFDVVDLTLTPEKLQPARDWAEEHNTDISAAPVVVVEQNGEIVNVWTGYRTDLMPTLKLAHEIGA